GRSASTRPSSETVPDWGRSTPAISLRSVVLPQPFGPRRPVNEPRGTARLTPETAGTKPPGPRRGYAYETSCATRYVEESGDMSPPSVLRAGTRNEKHRGRGLLARGAIERFGGSSRVKPRRAGVHPVTKGAEPLRLQWRDRVGVSPTSLFTWRCWYRPEYTPGPRLP